MKHGEYEIASYRPELKLQALEVLKYLYGKNEDDNADYLTWKHYDNPNTEHPLCIVALHKGKVVGFRGYFATRWKVSHSGKGIIVLCPGDTVVNPNHRRKDLSVAMGKMAMKKYMSKYKVFFNFSAGKNSAPGYMKMGFFPVIDKTYMTKYSRFGLIRTILAKKLTTRTGEDRIDFGKFDHVLVSDSPRPNAMSAVVAEQESKENKLVLVRDEDFFRWRFNNKRNKYVFYYHIKNDVVTGYVVIWIREKEWQGRILDYAENDGTAIETILRYAIKKNHFNALSIFRFSLDHHLERVLKGLGYRVNTLERLLNKKRHGEWPLLVRPVSQDFTENDWFIEGLDIRQVDSWDIKEICSDGS